MSGEFARMQQELLEARQREQEQQAAELARRSSPEYIAAQDRIRAEQLERQRALRADHEQFSRVTRHVAQGLIARHVDTDFGFSRVNKHFFESPYVMQGWLLRSHESPRDTDGDGSGWLEVLTDDGAVLHHSAPRISRRGMLMHTEVYRGRAISTTAYFPDKASPLHPEQPIDPELKSAVARLATDHAIDLSQF